ncbi:MAG: type II toxin-antitoxin system Phd/YefM family antitoxin [Deltaproteobacteria bacterium]|nr:type II toxin-antitoxin system Phd/YefM family antitoxin [Deltaproteobacteria bacterium]
MAKIVSASVLRNHLADALDEVGEGEKFLLVARNKELVSAVVDIDFFEDLLAAHAKEYVQSIREARKQYKQGQTLSHTQVFGKL